MIFDNETTTNNIVVCDQWYYKIHDMLFVELVQKNAIGSLHGMIKIIVYCLLFTVCLKSKQSNDSYSFKYKTVTPKTCAVCL